MQKGGKDTPSTSPEVVPICLPPYPGYSTIEDRSLPTQPPFVKQPFEDLDCFHISSKGIKFMYNSMGRKNEMSS